MGGAVAGAIDKFIPLPVDGIGKFGAGIILKNPTLQTLGGFEMGESLVEMFLGGNGNTSLGVTFH